MEKENTERGVSSLLRGERVVVLGCGKVGSAVAVLLGRAGVTVSAITTRVAESASAAQRRTGVVASLDNAAAAAQGDIVFVTTNDDSIEQVVRQVAEAGGFRRGQLVVHMSGALPLAVLAPAQAAGASVGILHPMQSFATPEDAAEKMPGSVFGVTAERDAEPLIMALASALGGEAVQVRDEDKALYHAAAVVASNYLVAVEDLAVQLLMATGVAEHDALRALRPLIAGTAENIGRLGTTAALTGPIVRGDVSTVRTHIEALSQLSGDELALYRALGRRTLTIAERRGTLSVQVVSDLRAALADDEGSNPR